MCSNPKVFCKEAILKNFLKFTRYHMHQNRKKYGKILKRWCRLRDLAKWGAAMKNKGEIENP